VIANAIGAYVESGKGEKLISPFEQAVAGLVLGGEEFVARICDHAPGASRYTRSALPAGAPKRGQGVAKDR
jgi:hypothetical protein